MGAKISLLKIVGCEGTYARRLFSLLQFCAFFVSVFLASSSHAQTVIVSPRDSAIVQLRNGKGELHLVLHTDAKTTFFQYRILDETSNAIKGYDWRRINFLNRRIDTILWLPLEQNLTLQWQTDGRLEGGLISAIKIGHLFAIAGQSNAQGWSPQPVAALACDARMLWSDEHWYTAIDPTGGKWGSPWIAFANEFAALVNDSLPIGIINVAVGGTGLTLNTAQGQWWRNGEMHDDTSTIYGAALTRIRAAGSDVEGFFWIQGESDVISTSVPLYQNTFATLIDNFEEDLHFPLRTFHFQIGGQTNNPGKVAWGIVREALRTLPNSTLVGGSVGLPLADDIHYTAAVAEDVGERFAAAAANVLYGVKSPLYPPPIPATMAKLVRCLPDDPRPGWKIEIQAQKNGVPCKLVGDQSPYGFQLTHDASRYDTSEVFATIDPHDPTKVDVFLKHHSIEPDPSWRLSYAIYGDVSNITLSDGTLGPAGLPNMLIAFLDLPVLDSAYAAGVWEGGAAGALTLVPDPVRDRATLSFDLQKEANVSTDVIDQLGRTTHLFQLAQLGSGHHNILLDCTNLVPGGYTVVLRAGSHYQFSKLFLLR